MRPSWLTKNLRTILIRFRTANCGNVVITFALALVPMMGFAGAAVDYSRGNSAKAAMQAALDATALMLAKDAGTLTTAQLNQKANDYFKAVFTRPEVTGVTITPVYTASTSQVDVTGSGSMKTDFIGIIGFSQLTISTTSTAKWSVSKLRVALVLDNTGSMADSGKMTALKAASHSLLTILQSAAQTAGDVQIAIIPFANGVNVDTANVNETWLDWSYYKNSGGAGWGSSGGWSGGSSGGSTSWSSGSGSWDNNGSWSGSGGSSCSWSSCWSSSGGWSATTSRTSKSHWQGCVMDRDQDYDVQNTAPTTSIKSTLFPAIYSTACPAPMMPLSYDWTALNSKIDTMVPTGSTNQTIGLVWGWHALTTGEPFDNTAPPAGSQQVIIMLTDGLNTENRWSTSQSSIDARTQKVCTNIKAAGITLYTVQVKGNGDPTSTMLQNCATDTGKFFALTSASQIVTTFNSIATNLSKLRIAK